MDEDSILGSQDQLRKGGLRHLRRTLKEKLSQNSQNSANASESSSIVLLEDSNAVPANQDGQNNQEEEEDSVLIQSQKNKKQEDRVLLKRRQHGVNNFEDSHVNSPLPRTNEDSVSPSRSKGLTMKRYPPRSPSKLSNLSFQNRDVDQFFTPNFESTRLLNITTPFTPQSRVRSKINLSQQSTYRQKLSLKQVAEGGTQVTPLHHQDDENYPKENEANLSLISIYKQRLRNKLVSEGGTQTTPTTQEPNQDFNSNNESVGDCQVSNASNSTTVSGFVNRLCQTQSNEILVPFTEEDFEAQVLDGENNSFTSNGNRSRVLNSEASPRANRSRVSNSKASPRANRSRVSNYEASPQANTSRVSNYEASPQANTSRVSNSKASPRANRSRVSHSEAPPPGNSSISRSKDNLVLDPSSNSLLENQCMHSPGSIDRNQTREEAVSRLHNSLDKVPPNLADPTSSLSESDSESDSVVDLTVPHQPDKTMKKLTPGSFLRRYGAKGKECDIWNKNGPQTRRKFARKSIHVNKGRALGFETIESLVSLKEGFEHFSLFCPFDLSKKAKETFMKVSQEILTDIIKRVTDEAFYNGGRTSACLKDVKQVMLQYKCFPPSPRDARYKNQHLYHFLRHNCDAQAAKCLLPFSSFDRKRDKFFVDIWEEVDDEAPKGVRNSKRIRKK